MSEEEWLCECGRVAKGSICMSCGAARSMDVSFGKTDPVRGLRVAGQGCAVLIIASLTLIVTAVFLL